MNAGAEIRHAFSRLRAVLAKAAHPVLPVDVVVAGSLQVAWIAELLRLVLDLWPRKCFCSPAIALSGRVASPFLGFDSFYAARIGHPVFVGVSFIDHSITPLLSQPSTHSAAGYIDPLKLSARWPIA